MLVDAVSEAGFAAACAPGRLSPPSLRRPTGARPLRSRRRDTRDAVNEIRLGQLLCSRLCHDLIGPAAAINAGEELIRGANAADDEEARELIAESARQLAGRLTFFRLVFGSGGLADASIPLSEAKVLAGGFVSGTRVRLDWPTGDRGGDPALPLDMVRLLLCLLMIGSDALPRGGVVSLAITDDGMDAATTVSLTATGPMIRLSDDISDALASGTDADVTTRTVHAFYLARLVERMTATLTVTNLNGSSLRLEAHVPSA